MFVNPENKIKKREKSIKEKTKLHVGKKFNRLLIVEVLRYGKGWDIICIAKCDCGETKEMSLYQIIRGKSKSCGCLRSEYMSKKQKTHGLLHHPLYAVWSGIKQRCTNLKRPNFKWYGAKNVGMCDLWKNDFVAFYTWALENGWKKGLQVDRFPDKTGDYSPNNCRISTSEVNSNNKTNNVLVNILGEELTLKQVSKKFEINYSTLQNRLRNKWNEQDLISTPRYHSTP